MLLCGFDSFKIKTVTDSLHILKVSFFTVPSYSVYFITVVQPHRRNTLLYGNYCTEILSLCAVTTLTNIQKSKDIS